MSFTDDFLKGLEKRNVKQSWTKQNDYSQYDDYTRDFLTSLEKRKKKKEEEEETSLVEDIAPVRSDRGKADLFGLDLVQKGAFDDGYQFGDVSKAILGTAGDIGYGLFQGIGGLAEGLVDSAGYLAAGVADLLGYEDTARSMRQTSSKSQMDQLDQLLGVDDYLEKYSVAGNTLDAVGQGVGQVGTLIATGGLASTGLGATALTTGLMGVSGVGSGISEAYEGGADDDEALTYGLISGAADAFSELIFGGLGKGINALGFGKGLSSADDVIAKAVSSKFKSTVAKNLTEFGIKAGAEGLEEVFAGAVQAWGKSITYMQKEDGENYLKHLGEILADENLFEQFIVGGLTSGIAQAGSVKTSIKTGQDFITGLTQNEQTVVDSLYESEIADKDLDKKEKKKIYDQILTKLDKGYIGIEDIERTLGGETYKAYKDTLDSETALKDKLTASQKEYNELKGIHWKERSQEQNSRLAELETEIKNLETQVNETTANSKLGELKSQLSKSVFELTKNDTKLQESYREEMRRGQDLELDVEQYKGAAKITAQNLLKGGMNNTNRVHDVVDLLTRIAADRNIVFDVATAQKIADAGLGVDGRFVNGVRTKDGIIINIESGKVLETTVGHELYHTFEDAGLHEELAKAIKEYAELKGVYKDRYNSAVNIYAKKDAKGNILKDANGNIVWVRDNVDIDSEIIADLVGEYLFTDADFINNLSVKHRNVFQKVYDEIKYLLKIATAGSEEARKLEEVKRAFDKAYKENKASAEANAETDAKYSLSESKTLYTGSPVTDIQQFKVGGANGAKQTGDRYGRGIYLTTNKTTAKGYAGDSGRVYEINADDLNIFDLNDPITEEMKATLHRELNGKDKQFRNSVLRNFRTEKTFTDFESAEKFFDEQRKVWKEEDGYYSANKPEIKSADDKTGIAVIEYTDFVNIDNAIGSLTGNQLYDALKSISTDDFASFITGHGFDGIAFDEDADNQQYVIYRNEDRLNILPDSKVKYSLTDSEGRQLSKEQSEYFKDSKARDEDGNLRVVYHGTYEDFTVFDISKTKYANAFGQGHYFTSKKTDAQNNYASGNGADVRTKVEELAWIYFEEMGYTEADYESNDAVEEWNDAYDKAEAFYASGKVVQAYLNIKNPLYAGKFGELYDANGNTVSARSAELLKELGYDGIIDYGVSDRFGRFQDLDDDTVHYIVFDSNQIKLTTNEKPTADPDIRFSLSDPNDIAPVDFRKSAKYLMVDKSNAQDFGDIAPTQKRTDAPVATDDEEIKAETLVDKDSFVVRRANELYEEITNLKKGVRASKSLGYLLDHGHEWRSIKTALLNIRDNPNQVVNENSAAESVAREMLGREYDEMVYELNEQTDVAGSIRTKMKSIQTEIDNNEKLREQANADYDAEIAEVQAKYDAKKNKNTIEANNLLRRIERLHRLKNTNDANYAKRIGDLEARLERMSQPTYKTAVQRRKKQSEYTELMESLVGDTSTWVDKKLGISYKINTLRRNLRDIVRDASGKQDIAKADAIYDELQGNYNRHEAELKRESKRLTQVFADMKLTSAEDTYAHMLGEFRHNPDSKLTEETVKEYYEQHKKDIDTAKVDKAIEEARKTFDELIARVNERLREQGMKEIPYRQGYFPHFTNPKQGFLAKLFNWKPVDHEIPTSIAGITETFNPERSWQSFNKERKSDITDYSLAQGLDTYIHGSLDWIYHIEDIQKRRAFENYIRYIHSEEGVKARIDAIRNNEEYDADETQKQIDSVYAEANNPLNNFVTDLRAGTNTLAGKKSSMDRSMEENTNRKIYSVMTNLNNRVNANMVVGSISSALTNFIPIVQSWVEVSPMYSLRGMGDTIRSTARDDGIINKSTFLTNRLIEEEKVYKTGWDKASDKAAILMNAVDSFTSQTVWRSKYLQNIAEGMSENEAIRNADQFAENVIAGRSRGNMPTIFDAKNPLTKVFTAFQLEVANQYGYMFKDAPTDSKNKARLVKGFATMFIGSYLYNALYSSLVGRNAAFDPLSIIEDLLGDLEDEEEEEAIVNLANNVIEEIPFVGGLLGGGRIPISSAIPYSGENEGFSKMVTDISDGNWENVVREAILSPLYYLVLPFGGGQVKKTNEGLGMFSEDHPIAGSYTAIGNLRFPVEDNFINRMQAALFGQYASQNARDYFDNNRTALKEKQIQEFIDVDIPIRDYWEYREGLSEQKTIKDKFDYIAGLDLPVAKKNILINNIVDREESVDLEGYEDFSTYEEFDFATKNPEKYTVAKAVGGFNSYTTHYKAMNDISADKDENGKSIVGSRKEKIIDYVNSLDIDYGMKIILFKSEYKADDTYNADILEYLNSRDDLTYEEIVTILTELDFTVDGNGNVYWD